MKLPNRTSEYRAWSPSKNKMGKVLSLNLDGSATIEFDDHTSLTNYCIPMQYTGVKSETNERIFEHDIVQRMCNNENCPIQHVGIVHFDEETGDYRMLDQFGSVPLLVGTLGVMMYGITLLGDIYRNPEVVKKFNLEIEK